MFVRTIESIVCGLLNQYNTLSEKKLTHRITWAGNIEIYEQFKVIFDGDLMEFIVYFDKKLESAFKEYNRGNGK